MSGHLKVCFCGRQALPGTSRCARHPVPAQTQSERLESQPWRQAYASQVYRRNRQLAYERDGGRCVICGVPVEGPTWISDHVVALTDGGTNDVQNLQTLCVDCSKVKTRSDRRARAERKTS